MYDRIKGFRDFYPPEMRARRAVIDTLEDVARRYGFEEIGTPALERAAMWIDKSDDDIVGELYAFKDQGGRHVTLTPELTPTVARMVVAKQQALPKPIKWYSTRPFWRYEQVQQGRQREFYQTNVDIFGSDEPSADAEVLAWAADSLTALGLTGSDFEMRLSHRDILSGLISTYDDTIDETAAIRAVDKSEKLSEPEYLDALRSAGFRSDDAAHFAELIETGDLDTLSEVSGSARLSEGIDNLEAVVDAIADAGVEEYCSVSLETARGLEYYTGVVFECFDSTGDVSRSIFGGGRYDTLIERFGGQPTPAVGVAPGHATLSLLLERAGVLPETSRSTDYYVLPVGDTGSVASSITRKLRQRGHIVETDISDRSFGRQLDYADSINAETTVIVGERDLKNDELTLKDMASGDQVNVAIEEFPGEYDRPTYDDFAG